MYPFSYQAPKRIDEAVEAMSASGDGKYLAGGHTLLPTMKQRLASPGSIVDLNKIDALRGIHREGDTIVIGALTRHVDVADSELVNELIPALANLAGAIGDPHVRNRGTIGGSIANNDPAADYPAACLALNATIHTHKRGLLAQDFFVGLFETALEDDELITSVRFPIPSKAAYRKFPNPASRYAMVGVFVAMASGGPRVAVTGASASGVYRWREAESALGADFSARALAGLKASPNGLNADLHADAEYRAHLVGVMARRALEEAVG